jgi:hypothetical protein
MIKRTLLFSFLLFTSTVYSQNWTAVGQGLNKKVYTLYADTVAQTLYAGGDFDSSGVTQLNHIGFWDGIQWNAMGSGFNSRVRDIEEYNGEIYAIGDFTFSGTTAVNYIAKWDGTNWLDVGGGLNSGGRALFAFNSELYAGGTFTTAGSQTCKYVAKWDGINWQSLDTNIVSSSSLKVMSLGSFQNELVIGGSFIANGTSNNISILSGGSWQPLSTGTNSFVTSILDRNTDLIITGYFSMAGSTSAICIAKWNGTTWVPYPSPTSSLVECNTVVNNNIVFGGYLNSFLNGSIASRCVATVDQATQNWSGITTGMNNSVNALATLGNTLYAGGDFDTAGTSARMNIAKIDATTIGIEKLSAGHSIQVFPNPFSDKIFIKTNYSDLSKLTIEIIDILGRGVSPTINFNGTDIEIDRGNLPNGVYFMRIWKDKELIGETKLIAI